MILLDLIKKLNRNKYSNPYLITLDFTHRIKGSLFNPHIPNIQKQYKTKTFHILEETKPTTNTL